MTARAIGRHQSGPLSVLRATSGESGSQGEGRAGRPAVMFLHGIGSSAVAFEPQMDALAEWYDCVAPDAPGYAHSASAVGPDTIEGFAGAVIDLLDRLGLARAALVGVSWGGVIATRVAADHPDRIWALVLADTSRGAGVTAEQAAAMRHRPVEIERVGLETFARDRTPRLLAPSAPATLIAEVGTTMVDAVNQTAYVNACESMATTDHTELLPTITVPTLVVVGAEDVICPPAESARLHELVPGSTLVTIDDAGHLANQEQPPVFNAAIREFFDRHRPPDRGPGR